jgi:capsular exopolysaccharide synthesis family protein
VPQEFAQPPASDLRAYLAILRYRKWTIVLIVALVVASALFFSLRQTPIYESEARVLVRPSAPAPGVAPPPVNLETERALIESSSVASRVQGDLGIRESVDALLDDLDVTVEANTEILSIRYADAVPVRAQQLSQGFAHSYISFRRDQAQSQFRSQAEVLEDQIRAVEDQIADVETELERTRNQDDEAALSAERDSLVARLGVLQQQMETLRTTAAQGVGGEIVQQATVPGSPASPDHVRNGLLALAVGLALGMGVAFLRERLDDRLASRGELETQIGAPVVATIPRITRRRPRRRRRERALPVFFTAASSGAAEAFRTLRTNVQFMARNGRLRVIGVVSPGAGEGKTTTAANLAVALGRADKRVIVVSGDVRRPTLHRMFEVNDAPGVTDILGGADPAASFQRPRMKNVVVLASGTPPTDPAELIASEGMERILEQLSSMADFVIVDTPPLLAVSDGVFLASRCDGVLVVADARTTERGALAHAREQLEQVGATILGGVLNNFDASRARYYSHYHGYYYASYQPRFRRGPRPLEESSDWDPGQMSG